MILIMLGSIISIPEIVRKQDDGRIHPSLLGISRISRHPQDHPCHREPGCRRHCGRRYLIECKFGTRTNDLFLQLSEYTHKEKRAAGWLFQVEYVCIDRVEDSLVHRRQAFEYVGTFLILSREVPLTRSEPCPLKRKS